MAKNEKSKVVQEQEKQVEELSQEKGMTKEDFLEKAQTSKEQPKKETKTKKQKQTKKETQPKEQKQTKKQKQIIGVKDLEEEFGIPGKTIRRYLRKMDENKKPRGPEPYQWNHDDEDLKKIRQNLKEIKSRKPSLG